MSSATINVIGVILLALVFVGGLAALIAAEHQRTHRRRKIRR